jgi:hypothetical protein
MVPRHLVHRRRATVRTGCSLLWGQRAHADSRRGHDRGVARRGRRATGATPRRRKRALARPAAGGASALGGRVRNIVVSRSRGSNFDAFKSVAVDDLASLIVDVLHAGVDPASLREAGRVKQRLLEVAAHLDEEPKTLPRLRQAVRFALTGQPPAGASYTPDEETRLLDYHNVDVRNRRDLADSLDKLADDLSTLAAFGPAAGK